MHYERELEKALDIVKSAGKLALEYYRHGASPEEKADLSPVTLADRESEQFISRQLVKFFPGDGILGEEGALIASSTGRRWLIDPIDGTKDFVRGNPFWSVQLALQEGNRIVLGVIHCPCMNEILFSAFGTGCFWNGERVFASGINRLDRSILMVSGFNAAWESWPEEALRALTKSCWTVRCYGGSYNIIMLARGKADVWLSGSGMEWDYAPARIIARECGAIFLTRRGDGDIDRKHCVVCAPGIESHIRALLNIPD
ncbi:MAG TPA: inositol monophosphatase [Acidobacteriota bacterium]|nr:inositol monophosphatase [Acidobacteriota bacterium]